MRMLVLAPLALFSMSAAAQPNDIAETGEAVSKCPPRTVTAAAPKPGEFPLRKLSEEPPVAHIAAVDMKVDRCSMMLVLAPGETALGYGWTQAPSGSHRPIE
jgi:hypothetical protein